jgi:hypothetical protein
MPRKKLSLAKNLFRQKFLLPFFVLTVLASALSISVHGASVNTNHPELENGGPTAGWSEQDANGSWVVSLVKDGFLWKTVYDSSGKSWWQGQYYLATSSLWQGAPVVNGVQPHSSNGPQAAWSEKNSAGQWVITITNQGKYWNLTKTGENAYSWTASGNLSSLFQANPSLPVIDGISITSNNGPQTAWTEQEFDGDWVTTIINQGKYWKRNNKNGVFTWPSSGRLSDISFYQTAPVVEGVSLLDGNGIEAAWNIKDPSNKFWITGLAKSGVYWEQQQTFTGTMQAQSAYVLGTPGDYVLQQGLWRADQSWVRSVPLTPGGDPDWPHPNAQIWNGPKTLDGLPGTGSIQAMSSYILNNEIYGTYNQGIWRSNQAWVRVVPLRENGTPNWSDPRAQLWNGPITLPIGQGDGQALAAYTLPAPGPNGMFHQELWRGGQGWTRAVPLKSDGGVDWSHPSAQVWNGPMTMTGLPGSGSMETLDIYLLPNNKLTQSLWRGGQGWSRTIPVVDGLAQWNNASSWSGPVSGNHIPGIPQLSWVGTGVIPEPPKGYGVAAAHHGDSHSWWFFDWDISPGRANNRRYLPLIKMSLSCAKVGASGCSDSERNTWAQNIANTVSANPQLKARVWLVYNEPNLAEQDNADAQQSALLYNTLYDKVKQVDKNAKFYCCGIIKQPNTNAWMSTFVTHLQRPLDGIHYHNYVPEAWYNGAQIISFMQSHYAFLNTLTVNSTGQQLGKLGSIITEWAGLFPADEINSCAGSNNRDNVMRPVATWMNDNAKTINLVGAGWYFTVNGSNTGLNSTLYENPVDPTDFTCLGDEYKTYQWLVSP